MNYRTHCNCTQSALQTEQLPFSYNLAAVSRGAAKQEAVAS